MLLRRIRVYLLTVPVLAACGAPPAHPTAAESPVWWSPQLGLASLAELAKRRQQPFEEPLDVTSPTVAQPATMTDCNSYASLRAQQYDATSDQAFAVMLHYAAVCRTLELLAAAKPATDDDLRGLMAEADLGTRLPPLLGAKVSPLDLERRQQATQQGLSWAALSPALVVNERTPTSVKLTDADSHTRIELFAAGDFDGDRRQDVVVETTSHGDEGNWHEVGLWLLGQAGAGPLKVLREIQL